MKHLNLSILILGLIWTPVSYGKDFWQSPILRDHPLVGKIIEQKTGLFITNNELINRLKQYDIIFIGEKHDNPDHHTIESMLITKLADKQTTIVFEMLDDRHSSALLNLSTEISLEQLKEKLKWPKKGWPWRDYGPLFLQTIKQGAVLKAGNIDRTGIISIYREGLESLKKQDRFASIGKVKSKLQVPLSELVYESHCRKVAKERLQPMIDIQLAKDASMAFALESAKTQRRLMITGGVHASKNIGIPRHLSSKNKSVTLLILEVEKNRLLAQNYPSLAEKQADFVLFTPKYSDEDYCSRFK